MLLANNMEHPMEDQVKIPKDHQVITELLQEHHLLLMVLQMLLSAAIVRPNSEYGVPNAGYSAGGNGGGDNGYNYGNAGNGGYDEGASVSFAIYTIHEQGS